MKKIEVYYVHLTKKEKLKIRKLDINIYQF